MCNPLRRQLRFLAPDGHQTPLAQVLNRALHIPPARNDFVRTDRAALAQFAEQAALGAVVMGAHHHTHPLAMATAAASTAAPRRMAIILSILWVTPRVLCQRCPQSFPQNRGGTVLDWRSRRMDCSRCNLSAGHIRLR
jgi:hypothetical protein